MPTARWTCPPGPSKHSVPPRFEITDEIPSDSSERQVWRIFCYSRSDLNSIYRFVSLDGSKGVQGMWSDSNPVELVPPISMLPRVALSCPIQICLLPPVRGSS